MSELQTKIIDVPLFLPTYFTSSSVSVYPMSHSIDGFVHPLTLQNIVADFNPMRSYVLLVDGCLAHVFPDYNVMNDSIYLSTYNMEKGISQRSVCIVSEADSRHQIPLVESSGKYASNITAYQSMDITEVTLDQVSEDSHIPLAVQQELMKEDGHKTKVLGPQHVVATASPCAMLRAVGVCHDIACQCDHYLCYEDLLGKCITFNCHKVHQEDDTRERCQEQYAFLVEHFTLRNISIEQQLPSPNTDIQMLKNTQQDDHIHVTSVLPQKVQKAEIFAAANSLMDIHFSMKGFHVLPKATTITTVDMCNHSHNVPELLRVPLQGYIIAVYATASKPKSFYTAFMTFGDSRPPTHVIEACRAVLIAYIYRRNPNVQFLGPMPVRVPLFQEDLYLKPVMRDQTRTQTLPRVFDESLVAANCQTLDHTGGLFGGPYHCKVGRNRSITKQYLHEQNTGSIVNIDDLEEYDFTEDDDVLEELASAENQRDYDILEMRRRGGYPSFCTVGIFPDQMTPVQCPVCLDNVEPKQDFVNLPCFHKFHNDCISQWFKEHVTCPVCFFNLVRQTK